GTWHFWHSQIATIYVLRSYAICTRVPSDAVWHLALGLRLLPGSNGFPSWCHGVPTLYHAGMVGLVQGQVLTPKGMLLAHRGAENCDARRAHANLPGGRNSPPCWADLRRDVTQRQALGGSQGVPRTRQDGCGD